jgi:hypothetical protein
MKKFSEYVVPVSEALINDLMKESQEADAKKFQAMLENFGVAKFSLLTEEQQGKIIEALKF